MKTLVAGVAFAIAVAFVESPLDDVCQICRGHIPPGDKDATNRRGKQV